jgi:hypothetical protein
MAADPVALISPVFIAPFVASYVTKRALSFARTHSIPFFLAPSLPSDASVLLSVSAPTGTIGAGACMMAVSWRLPGILWPVCWPMGGVAWLAVVGTAVCGCCWVRWPSPGFIAGLIVPVLRFWGRYRVVAWSMVGGVELPSGPLFLYYFVYFIGVGASCAGIIWVGVVTHASARVYSCANFVDFATCAIPVRGWPVVRPRAFISMLDLLVASGVARLVVVTHAGVRVFRYAGCTVVVQCCCPAHGGPFNRPWAFVSLL